MAHLNNEERYFLVKEIELRAWWRRHLEEKAKEIAERRKVARHVGVDDEQVVSRIRELGFDGQNARVLHLIPLIEVAWADGSISKNEREIVLAAADKHGIEPGTEAAVLLTSLLEQRPSDIVLEELLEVLKEVLHAKDLHPVSILDACLQVAEASGGVLGFGNPISSEERKLIEQIAGIIGEDAKKRISDRLSG